MDYEKIITMPPYILASKSPRRLELFAKLGVEFAAEDSGVDEKPASHYPPHLPMILARGKAAALTTRFPDSIIVGADTMIAFEGRMIGKPQSLHEARKLLLGFSGKTHTVVTGVCLLRHTDNLVCVFTARTHVTFSQFDTTRVDAYFSKVDPLDKAGGYAAQTSGDMIIEKMEGSFNNVIGLPTERLAEVIAAVTPRLIP